MIELIKECLEPWVYVKKEVERYCLGESYIVLVDSDFRFKEKIGKWQQNTHSGHEGTDWWEKMDPQAVDIVKTKLKMGQQGWYIPLKKKPPENE